MPHRAARDLVLFLLSLHAAAHALLAWDPGTAAQPWRLALWAGLLAAAAAGAERTGVRLAAASEWAGRGRLRIALAALHALLVFTAPAAVATDPRLIGGTARLFALLQIVFLLLASSESGVAGALVNALTLTLLASLRGGALAAGAVTGSVAWLGTFLVFDRFARTLAAHPRSRVPPLTAPLRQAAAALGPVVLATAAVSLLLPPTPFAGAAVAAALPLTNRDVALAYNVLTLLALAGGAAVYGLARLLRRARRGEPPLREAVEASDVVEETLPLPERRPRVVYPGLRGRIVRAYVRFLEEAGRRALRRRPSQTPRELAALVAAPAGPLGILTDHFMRARYGPDEPGEDDARQAEQAAAAVVASLGRTVPRARWGR